MDVGPSVEKPVGDDTDMVIDLGVVLHHVVHMKVSIFVLVHICLEFLFFAAPFHLQQDLIFCRSFYTLYLCMNDLLQFVRVQ